MFASFATSRSALAAGCLLICSAEAATVNNSAGSTFWAGVNFVTYSRPVVTVPVLSNTSAVILPAVSRSATFFMRIPRRAEAEIAATTAVGVARMSAHGQAITSIAMPLLTSLVKNRTMPTIIIIVGVYHVT